MKDNYSWLDSFLEEFRLDVIDHFNEGGGNLQQTKTDAKQTIISQIEIEKLRARIEETTLWYKEWGYGKDRIGDGSWEDYFEYRTTTLQEKLKELEK